jgi:outer membrane protein assembly complex protein YaeT
LISGWVCPSTIAQQAPAGAAIDAVEIEGNVATTEAYIRNVIRTAAGQPLDQTRLDQDVGRLLATGRFLTASADTETRDGRLIVVFQVAERPVISDVRFRGNAKLKDKKLLEMVPLGVGDPVDAFDVREGRDNIVAAYREEGYGNVVVGHDADLLAQAGELVYTIEEGPRVRVRQIRFEGNDSFDRRELQKQIETQTYLWIFRDGNFDVDRIEQDAAAVQNFYRGEGFLDARASYRIEPGKTAEDMIVVFVVAEGTRYQVEAISVAGNSVFTAEALLAELRTRSDQVIRRIELDRDVRDIQTRYFKLGYIYARVRAFHVFSETPGLVLVRIEIEEGDPYRVGRIVPRGNEGTKDKVVRRALDLYPPDDVIDLTELREAEQRLRETQIFSRATITPVGEAEGVRDLVMDVEESARAGDFIFGVGVNSNSGVLGSVVLDVKNFDLFDWPRSFSEFVRLRSFRGAGQRMRIEAQPGTEFNRFRIDFVEPYFLDKPIRLGTSAYFFDRGRESYDERRVGGSVSLGKRLTEGWLKDWYADVTLRVEDVDVDDLDLFAPRDVRDVEGSNLLTSVRGTLTRDRTDSRFVPTRGDVFRLSWEQFGVLGGEDFFAKTNVSYTWHKTLVTDVQERKGVLSLRGDVGGIFGNAPVFERFYAGGIGSIRGFEFRGVSPRQGLDEDPIGGDFLALLKAEYSFPLYGDNLRGVFFSDMGTVEDGFELTSWRASIGFGVRLQIDFFGPVPLEFDLAVPVLKDGDDEEQVFSFFIGATF